MNPKDLEHLCCYHATRYYPKPKPNGFTDVHTVTHIMCLVWKDSEVPVPPGTLTDLANPEETQPGLNNANQRIAMLSNQIKGVQIG